MIRYFLSPARITALLFVTTFALLIIHLACVYAEFLSEAPYPYSSWFYFDRRLNIPFFFSLGLLLASALLSLRLSHATRKNQVVRSFWSTLAVLLGSAAIDKFLHLHNRIRTTTANLIDVYDPTNPVYHVWTIPYVIFLFYIAWRLRATSGRLPLSTRRQLIIAFSLILTGGVILELAGVAYAYLHGWQSDIYHVLIKTTEELFQIVGLVLIIRALLDYRTRINGLQGAGCRVPGTTPSGHS